MSKKIDVFPIVKAHFDTLRDYSTGKYSWVDIIVFTIIPILTAISFVYFKFSFVSEVSSLLINFGAIFTALLLSVLVMIYDQKMKLIDANDKSEGGLDEAMQLRLNLVSQLYVNICFAVLVSILVVVFSFLNFVWSDVAFDIPKTNFCIKLGWSLFTPITVYLTLTLVLTVFMVIKRMFYILSDY